MVTVEYATKEEERKYQEAQQEGQGVGNRQHEDSSWLRLGKRRIRSDRNVVYRRFYAKRLEIRKIRGRIRTFFTWDFHFKDTK